MGPVVDKVLKKAKLSYDLDIVTAATDKKVVSGKRVTSIILGFFMLAASLFLLFVVLYGVDALFTTPFNIIADLVIVILMVITLLLGMFCLYGAFQLFSPKSDWFIVLYKDKILYKYLQDNSYHELVVPINDIHRCIVMHKFTQGARVNGKDTSQYHISVHFAYVENDEEQFISLYLMDGYGELNQMITYLTKIKKIPFYYAEINQGISEKIDDKEGLLEAEKETFLGDLKHYQKVSSIHYFR